ncbi:MAG: enolase C-terminal domain-like protein [Candidatus Thermoplasmatota archaeon]|nr:enolase C-terminal domain-like protein [Candidatus Thermoplasmatota archaeon]
MIIKEVDIRRIIDSRGNPTVEADITTERGFGRAAAPAGASTGTHEAMAWPNGSVSKGMEFARENVIPKIIGLSADKQEEFDKLLRNIDSSDNFSNLGGNVAVALSLATAKAAADTKKIPLFQYLSEDSDYSLPAPMANVLGGGAHAVGGTDIQEYLVTAFHDDFSTAIEANALVHKTVKSLLKEKFPNIALGKGDEGAWVAPLENVEALELVVKAARMVEQETGVEIRPGLDIAASEFYDGEKYNYKEQSLTPEEQVDFVLGMIEEYNLHSVEDPLDQEDYESWALLTEQTDALIIGDDLYVTNAKRLQKGINMKSTNSILIKPNQIGTLTDTKKAVDLAHSADMATVISHRSGETTDSTIAHLGVAFGSHAIKTGIMGGERIAKLNELVRISEQLR